VVAHLSGLLVVVCVAAAVLEQSAPPRQSLAPKSSETAKKDEDIEKHDRPKIPITPPRCFYKPSPRFTKEAIKAGFEGPVEVNVVIELDGSLSNVRLKNPIGFGLDKDIVKAVKTWRCKPATYDGKPARTPIPIEIRFRLKQSAK